MFSPGLTPYLLLPLAGLGGAVVGWYWVQRKLARIYSESDADVARASLEQLQSLAANVDQHAEIVKQITDDLRRHGDPNDECVVSSVTKLIQANQLMQRQLNQAEEKLQAQARQIETSTVEARTDALTQVNNRRAFDDTLRRSVAEFKRRGRPTALMLLDVDHFKKFNDTHGHQAGDEVLKVVARTLKQSVTENEFVARYGGEEFAILFCGSSLAAARQLAEVARRAINQSPFTFQGKELRVAASAGLAELTPKDDEKSLVVRADEALYAAKRGGRNCGYWNDGQANHRLVLAPERGKGASPLADDWTTPAPNEATIDSLLGVSKRGAFFDDVIRRLAAHNRGGAPLSLLLLQIDGLPRIIADQGAQAASRVVRIAVQLMKATMRDMDHLGQLSDDTFSLLLPGANLTNTTSIAERIRTNVERCRLPRQAGALPFTVSMGCVEAADNDEMRAVMERARRALEAAVQQGRNRTWYHDGREARPAADLSATAL